jgi:hypothetical protein
MQTISAVLHSAFRIAETAAAPVAQGIQRTVAEKAVEIVRFCTFMAGEIFAGSILKVIVICHR